MQESCGVVACCLNQSPQTGSVADYIFNALLSLQHRGQESAGIVAANIDDPNTFIHERGKGLVSAVFKKDDLKDFCGSVMGIGHTRYSTHGSKDGFNCIQPYVLYSSNGLLAVAHNGELVNSGMLREKVLKGSGLSTDTDSELIAQMLATLASSPFEAKCEFGIPGASSITNGDNGVWPNIIRKVMAELSLAYSLAILTPTCIYAVRDPYGNRPLCIGKLEPLNDNSGSDKGLGWIITSESCVFRGVGAKLFRDVRPGEIIEVSPESGLKSLGVHPMVNDIIGPKFCIFEYVYFLRSDSVLETLRNEDGSVAAGQQVYAVRRRCGEQLGREAPVDSTNKSDWIISTVPDSATPAAIGYARITGLNYGEVLSKNRYEGRTFIHPDDVSRRLAISRKFAPLEENYKGKRVVLIDDSIVRGNTMKPIVSLLKATGAAEVHIRIASPPLRHPCYMGINIPTSQELVANRLHFPKDLKPGENLGQFAEYLGADSVVYLSLDGLVRAVKEGIADNRSTKHIGYCTACLSGEYPVDPKLDW